MKFLVAGILGVALLFGACRKPAESAQEQEVRAAVEAHLRTKGNLALNNMNMEIQSVKFNGDTAEAQVRFQSKEQPQLAVGFHYVLRRAGDHWEVESSSPAAGMGADSHQAPGAPANPMQPAPSAAPNSSHPSNPKPEASH